MCLTGTFTETAGKISLVKGVKRTDAGGRAVKKIFLFAEKVKTAGFAAEIILILSCLIAGWETVRAGKSVRDRYAFLRERGFGKKQAVIKNLTPIILTPLLSALAAVFILYVISVQAGGGLTAFLSTPQTAFVFILSFIPWLFIIYEK